MLQCPVPDQVYTGYFKNEIDEESIKNSFDPLL